MISIVITCVVPFMSLLGMVLAVKMIPIVANALDRMTLKRRNV